MPVRAERPDRFSCVLSQVRAVEALSTGTGHLLGQLLGQLLGMDK